MSRRSNDSPGLKPMASTPVGDWYSAGSVGEGSSSLGSDDGLTIEWLARGSNHGVMDSRLEQVLYMTTYSECLSLLFHTRHCSCFRFALLFCVGWGGMGWGGVSVYIYMTFSFLWIMTSGLCGLCIFISICMCAGGMYVSWVKSMYAVGSPSIIFVFFGSSAGSGSVSVSGIVSKGCSMNTDWR